MESFEVSEKVFSFADGYEVKKAGSDEVAFTVVGKIVTIGPKLTLRKGLDGAEAATLTGDALNSHFKFATTDGKHSGAIDFATGIKKHLSMTLGSSKYEADGDWLAQAFDCKDGTGALALRIQRSGVLRAKFAVEIHAALPAELGVLAAVAIHQKYS